MANSFGSLWIGASGLKSASNALNVTSNNLTNVNSSGYVREQVVFADMSYTWFGNASISKQMNGLGVDIGDVVHARDIFLDKAFRSEQGRYKFYQANYEAVNEVEVYLQEMDGASFRDAVRDLYEAFSEFSKDPSDTVNQNLILQKSGLFLSRSEAVYQGLLDYQTLINTKITNDVNRINKIGKELNTLNKEIQRIEAGNVETAMTLRDERDVLLDELAGLTRMSYKELPNGVVKVQIEGTLFVDETSAYKIELKKDTVTDFVTPYWESLSDVENDIYYPVWTVSDISAERGNDIGEVKALLMARGDHYANYSDMMKSATEELSESEYENGLADSIMMNAESELDRLVHKIMVEMNERFSPTTTAAEAYADQTALSFDENNPTKFMVSDHYGDYYFDTAANKIVKIPTKEEDPDFELPEDAKRYSTFTQDTRVADINNCPIGSDGKVPAAELFVRAGVERFREETVLDPYGNPITYMDENGVTQTLKVYVYNEEDAPDPNDPDYNVDTTRMYCLRSTKLNQDMVETESLLAHKYQNGDIAYDIGESLETLWETQNFYLNPGDTTPCSFTDFYTKWIGEVGTVGSVYYTTSFSLEGTATAIENNRQAVIGVSSDEELASIIKYQSAYNAASRYMTTISSMIEHLLNSLGR